MSDGRPPGFLLPYTGTRDELALLAAGLLLVAGGAVSVQAGRRRA